MQTATLKCATLHLLPGVAEDFDQQIEQLVADCRRRPGLAKARVLKIELRITPDEESADDVVIEPILTTRSPARTLDPVRARRSVRNQLQFYFMEEE